MPKDTDYATPAQRENFKREAEKLNRLATAILEGAASAGIFDLSYVKDGQRLTIDQLVGLAHDTGKTADHNHKAVQQRDRLIKSVAAAGSHAGVVDPATLTTGRDILMAINKLGMAAKQSTGSSQTEKGTPRPVYTTESGKAAYEYFCSFGENAPSTPPDFRFEELFNRMLAECDASPSVAKTDAQTAEPIDQKLGTGNRMAALMDIWERFNCAFQAYRHGSITVSQEDVRHAMSQLSNQANLGAARNVLTEKDKEWICWATDVFNVNEISAPICGTAMDALSQMMGKYPDPRNDEQTQEAQSAQAILDNFVNSGPSDSPLVSRARNLRQETEQLLADIKEREARESASAAADLEEIPGPR